MEVVFCVCVCCRDDMTCRRPKTNKKKEKEIVKLEVGRRDGWCNGVVVSLDVRAC